MLVNDGVNDGEQTRDYSRERKWAKWAVQSKQTIEQCEVTDQRVALHLHLDSCLFWTIARLLIVPSSGAISSIFLIRFAHRFPAVFRQISGNLRQSTGSFLAPPNERGKGHFRNGEWRVVAWFSFCLPSILLSFDCLSLCPSPSHMIRGYSKKSVSWSRPRREVRFFACCSACLK